MLSSKSGHLRSAAVSLLAFDRGLLTVDALEEYVENAVARYGELVFVKEGVLYALLVVLVAVEVVLLKVVEEATCDGADAFNVHLRGAKLLLAVLDGVLEILKREDELQQTISVELERGGVVRTLWNIVGLVKDDD